MNDYEFTYLQNGEKPLDSLKDDGGFCGVFRKIACIGDSLSSGEFETVDKEGNHSYLDCFDYSWGQYLARMVGSNVLNFSRGGMSAKEYYTSFAEANCFWDRGKACQAYVIALGVNDLNWMQQEIGSASDTDSGENNGNQTFAWYYARIIERYKKIQPNGKFFFVTMPKEFDDQPDNFEIKKNHAELMHEFAKKYINSYVIDLNEYAPVFDEKFKKNHILNGHMTPSGYMILAKIIANYIDYIVRSDFSSFKQVGLIGLPQYDESNK